MASTAGFSRTPASISSLAPPTVSSAGWKTSLTVPGNGLLHLQEKTGRSQEDRHVDIVAAGVHLAGDLRPVGHILAVL